MGRVNCRIKIYSRGATVTRTKKSKQSKINYMYTITISTYSSSQSFEFSNIREALNSFVERCDALGYDYTENENGTFNAGGFGHSHELELTLNF